MEKRHQIFSKFIIFMLLLSSGCASTPVKWDKADKRLMTSLTIAYTVDCLQTMEIIDNPEYIEENPIIKNFSKNEVPLYFAGSLVSAFIIANKLKPLPRKIYLTTWMLFESYCVTRNYRLGVRIKL